MIQCEYCLDEFPISEMKLHAVTGMAVCSNCYELMLCKVCRAEIDVNKGKDFCSDCYDKYLCSECYDKYLDDESLDECETRQEYLRKIRGNYYE